jgi:hypothetical protein
VDAPSDDEGDEEAGARARADQQRRDDDLQTKKIAQVVAGGYASTRHDKSKGKFSDKDLIRDDDDDEGTAAVEANKAEEEVPEEGPAMLEWLNSKMRNRKTREVKYGDEDYDYSDDGEEGLSETDDLQGGDGKYLVITLC